jgi:hypothetical protein
MDLANEAQGGAAKGSPEGPVDNAHGTVRLLCLAAAAIWIIGGTLFFLVRFSSVLYYANKDPIDGILNRILR